ncbi:hypothetical protein YC2023_084043 [Brassica napus]
MAMLMTMENVILSGTHPNVHPLKLTQLQSNAGLIKIMIHEGIHRSLYVTRFHDINQDEAISCGTRKLPSERKLAIGGEGFRQERSLSKLRTQSSSGSLVSQQKVKLYLKRRRLVLPL